VDFSEIAALNQEPTAATLEPVIAAYLERHGPTKRSVLAHEIEAQWLAASGQPFTSDVMVKVKKALNHMEQRGSVISTGAFGVWALPDEDGSSSLGAVAPEAVEAGDSRSTQGHDEDDEDEVPAQSSDLIELGGGEQLVYCFYLPTYREKATHSGQDRWPIKIGRTTGSLTTRLASLSTAMPEAPVISVLIRTHNADVLEKAIQNILSFRGRWMSEAGGSEWYSTNPQEIAQIYEFVSRNSMD
jgi:hypothetical protein